VKTDRRPPNAVERHATHPWFAAVSSTRRAYWRPSGSEPPSRDRWNRQLPDLFS